MWAKACKDETILEMLTGSEPLAAAVPAAEAAKQLSPPQKRRARQFLHRADKEKSSPKPKKEKLKAKSPQKPKKDASFLDFDRQNKGRQLIKDAILDMYTKFSHSHAIDDEDHLVDLEGKPITGARGEFVNATTVSILAVQYFFTKYKGRTKENFGREVVAELNAAKGSLRVHIINMFVWADMDI